MNNELSAIILGTVAIIVVAIRIMLKWVEQVNRRSAVKVLTQTLVSFWLVAFIASTYYSKLITNTESLIAFIGSFLLIMAFLYFWGKKK